MRAVVLDYPDELLEERRRKGLDGRDELWEGELHMVPPAGGPHQRLGTELMWALRPVVDRLGLRTSPETGLFAASDDYRIADWVVATEAQCSDRGVEGAVLVIEIRSPYDETDAKVPWYAARQVDGIVAVDPQTKVVELWVPRGGVAFAAMPDAEGWVTLPVLGVRMRAGAGPSLQVDRGAYGGLVEL